MNKLQKILIAIMGGFESVFTLVSPILLCAIWVKFWNMEGMVMWLLYSLGFISSVFRGYRLGWLKNGN